MKLTKKTLKRIIKEELEAVMEAPLPIYGAIVAAAAKKRRAAEKTRKEKAAEEERRKREYERGKTQRRLDALKKTSGTKAPPVPTPAPVSKPPQGPAAMSSLSRGEQRTLDELLAAKHRAIFMLDPEDGSFDDGNLPYMYTFGRNDEYLFDQYYYGDHDLQWALGLAEKVGEFKTSEVDPKTGGFDLATLFPGK